MARVLHHLMLSRQIRAWRSLEREAAERKERRRLHDVAMGAFARMQHPHLVAMFQFWHKEQMLAAVERQGDPCYKLARCLRMR